VSDIKGKYYVGLTFQLSIGYNTQSRDIRGIFFGPKPMFKITLNLPNRRVLSFKLEKRRGRSVQKNIFKDLSGFVAKRGGTKVSRFFRFLLDKYSIKNILGANLVILSLFSSFVDVPHKITLNDETLEVRSPIILTTKRGVRVPLDAQNVTQGYWGYHRGVDLNGNTGDSIYPMSGGVVEEATYSNSGYGQMVVVNHKNGYKSLYAHLSKIEVKQGEEVTNETKIGEVGATGRAIGDHLHLEVYENGSPINPLSILPK